MKRLSLFAACLCALLSLTTDLFAGRDCKSCKKSCDTCPMEEREGRHERRERRREKRHNRHQKEHHTRETPMREEMSADEDGDDSSGVPQTMEELQEYLKGR